VVSNSILDILSKRESARVVILTLGTFEVYLDGKKVSAKEWKRDKSLQLLQFMLLGRNRKALHKEQIMDRLWEDEIDDQGFKVALHGIHKVLEPEKKSHAEPIFIERIGHTYRLVLDDIWIDAMAFESLVSLGNKNILNDHNLALDAYQSALSLHKGQFLPDRIYEDWSADERERLQLMFLNASISLADLLLNDNPAESIQLCQEALLVDVAWEDAYRIQMAAFYSRGNRPMAIKTYQVCEKVLWEEMGLKPLPETRKLYEKIIQAD
jgi:DNA-binding SARP family transcriptional activator